MLQRSPPPVQGRESVAHRRKTVALQMGINKKKGLDVSFITRVVERLRSCTNRTAWGYGREYGAPKIKQTQKSIAGENCRLSMRPDT